MSSFCDYVVSQAVPCGTNVQISGLLIAQKDLLTLEGRPDYLYLKDLVNPQQVYWDHIKMMPPTPPELKKVWDFGNMMHDKAGFIFSRMQGFSDSRGKIDGAEVGIPGIRGRIDFRLKDSIVEFKTTEKDVSTPENVWKNVPQDIEQLLFYSALWTHQPDHHYLVFYTQDEKLTVYKVQLEDLGKVRNIIKQRRDRLLKAIETKEPKFLKRCRYFDGICAVKEGGLCTCQDLDLNNTDPLQQASKMVRESDMGDTMNHIWKSASSDQSRLLRPWDLEIPKLAYGILKGDIVEEPWTPQDEDKWIWKALTNTALMPGFLNMPSRPRIESPLKFMVNGTYLIKKATGDKVDGHFTSDSILTPTIIRWWPNDYLPQPHYKALRAPIMNLGVLCALSGKTNGLLIFDAPETGAKVITLEFTFKDLRGIEREVHHRLRILKDALDKSDHSILNECPDFIKDKKCSTCKMTCESKKK